MSSIHVQNVYNRYYAQEWSKKFQCSGVYSITVNNKIVYIGKSNNILYRMAEHWCSMGNPKENKYKVLAEANRRNYSVRFHVLYTAKSKTRAEIEEEIGEREGYFIRLYQPPLNTQIPKEENWRSYTVNRGALNISLDDIMEGEYI